MIGTIRKSCPVCGGRIEISVLYQYAHEYLINKNGKVSNRYTVRDCGPMEVMIASCLDCGEHWDADQFTINADDRFVDFKYDED